MSRGLGHRHREIIERLQRAVEDGCPQWIGSDDLSNRRTASEAESVRQSLRSLERRGLIEVRRGRRLQARLQPSASQLARERRRERRAARRQLETAGWSEILWWAEEAPEALPSSESPVGRRLIRAGLPSGYLDAEWWDEHSISDLPAWLRAEPTFPREPRRIEREERRRMRREEEQRRAESRRRRLGRGAGVVA
jgi:hypothetical protein